MSTRSRYDMTEFVPRPPASFPTASACTKILMNALLASGAGQTPDQTASERHSSEPTTPPQAVTWPVK